MPLLYDTTRKAAALAERELAEITEKLRKQVAGEVKAKFDVTPEVTLLEIGTLAKEFETSVKAPRFVDRRE